MLDGRAAPRLFTLVVGVLGVYLMATGVALLARGTYPYRDRDAEHGGASDNGLHLLRSLLGVALLVITFIVHVFTEGR